MTKTKGLLLAAGFMLAMAFTFSCSGDDGGGEPSPSGGGGYTGSYGYLADSRDSKTYRTVVIGTQTWMAENLNYNASGSKCGDNGSLSDNNTTTCNTYGRLYNWSTAKTVCPSGWHLPTKGEWEVMTAFIGGESTEGKKLKATSGWYDWSWRESDNGTNEYGFSALPGGYSEYGILTVGREGNWWSASEDNSDNAYTRRMNYDRERATWYTKSKDDFYSVRCLQN